MIPFNKQNLFGKEFEYINEAYSQGKISGDGKYTKMCEKFIENKFGTKKAFLTTSCTHALEMAALLCEIKEGDEIIMPSYTFVSTANAFVLRGGKPVFCDIRRDNLNINEKCIEKYITEKTKVIVPVHYMGVPCEMDAIMKIAKKYDLVVVEDAAQGVNSTYKGKYLGTIGDFGTYSFHETKNYSMGEGGALLVNNDKYIGKAEIIREKGTNRSRFFRGEIDKYSWVDIGSSYLPSDINAAILWNQFENLSAINDRRKEIFKKYLNGLKGLEEDGMFQLPKEEIFKNSNYSGFYMILNDETDRIKFISYLKSHGIGASFHYVPLHLSEYFKKSGLRSTDLKNTENLSLKIVRLPFYYSLKMEEVDYIIEKIKSYGLNLI